MKLLLVRSAVAVAAIAVLVPTASAAGVTYDAGPEGGGPADLDPVLQGWVETEVNDGSDVPADQNVFFLQPDGFTGFNATQLNDQHGNTPTDNPGYNFFLTNADFTNMLNNGWEYFARFRPEQGGGFSGWGWSAANDVWGAGGRDRFGISVGLDSTDPTAVSIATQDGYSTVLAADSAEEFHTVRAVGIPGGSTYNLFIDGTDVGAIQDLLQGTSNSASDDRVLWQSGSSGGTGRVVNWNHVSLTFVPEPSTLLLCGLGLIGVIGARRRS
jgi:hypothetical protein